MGHPIPNTNALLETGSDATENNVPSSMNTMTPSNDDSNVRESPTDHQSAGRLNRNKRPILRRIGSIQKRTQARVGSKSETSGRKLSSMQLNEPSDIDSPGIISRLFHSTIEFWCSVLDQKSWPFRFKPSSSTAGALLEKAAPESHIANTEETNAAIDSFETTSTMLDVELTAGPNACSQSSAQYCWDVARVRLSEERDRLCLWKSRFDEQGLDALLNSSSGLYHDLGLCVVETLLGIADSLHTSIELPETDQSTDGDLTDIRLHETAQRLEQSVVEGWEMISGVDREDSMRLDITPATTTADPSEEDEWANLFGKLQNDVARLSRLTLQIKLALAVIKDEKKVLDI